MMTIRRGFIAAILVAASAITLAAQTRTTEAVPTPLTGSAWVLDTIEGTAPVTGREPADLTFGEGGQFGASAGCNRFKGTAEIKGEEITFPDQLAGTMMACPEDLAAQEEHVLDLLAQVSRFTVAPTELNLLNAEGEELLRYTREAPEAEVLIDTKG
ncbi:META domain-containing protein [Arenibacterium sp. LLYu02]|uniref:META domain-containing protein n=1 Tax=Arenibacterium sp. LLYu02 TaxID=3404132 RepID=UPI003B21865F